MHEHEGHLCHPDSKSSERGAFVPAKSRLGLAVKGSSSKLGRVRLGHVIGNVTFSGYTHQPSYAPTNIRNQALSHFLSLVSPVFDTERSMLDGQWQSCTLSQHRLFAAISRAAAWKRAHGQRCLECINRWMPLCFGQPTSREYAVCNEEWPPQQADLNGPVSGPPSCARTLDGLRWPSSLPACGTQYRWTSSTSRDKKSLLDVSETASNGRRALTASPNLRAAADG